MACARLAKPTGVFCFRSHPVKVARVGSSMAIPIAECRPCICFSPGMCCPDDRAPWRAHCQFFYPFSMGTCTEWPKVADAVIEANPRNRKATKRGRKRLFNDAIHALRMRVERTFAWEDT